MSLTKRWIEGRAEEVADSTGNSWDYIFNWAMWQFNNRPGGIDFDYIKDKASSMEIKSSDIKKLAEDSGYDEEVLQTIIFEAIESDDEFDWDYIVEVSMERDW